MNFSKALEAVRIGARITRKGWNGKGLWIEVQRPDANSKMTRPYLFIVSPPGSTSQFGGTQKLERVPWLASQTDILAEDWEILAETGSTEPKKKLYAFRSIRRSKEVIWRDNEYGANKFYRRDPSSDKVLQ